MSLSIQKYFCLVFSVGIMLTTDAQQGNKPNSSTVPVVSSVHTPAAYNGTLPVNYVRTWEAMGPYTNPTEMAGAGFEHVKQTTDYFDGLGRPLQTVVRQITAGVSPRDLVKPIEYDNFGRESYKYMSYVANATNGAFRIDPFAEQKAYLEAQYTNPAEKVFYAKTNFEASPLNRAEKTMAPGNSWAGNNVGVEHKYLTNTAPDEVVKWEIASNPLTYSNNDVTTNIPVVSTGTYYEAGQLYKSVTIDEKGNATVDYADKHGQLVLKKVQVGSIPADYGGNSGFLSTYYIYDDFGNLRFILPPKATEAIRPDWSLSTASTVINELCFRYEFDYRQRMIAKKVPGTGWAYMVYDMRDRLVFNQDGNMRTRNQWHTTLYDALDRPVITGMTNWIGTPAALQSIVATQTATPTIPPGTPVDLPLSQPTYGDYVASNSITLSPGFEAAVGGSSFSASIFSENAGTVNMEGVTVNKFPVPPGASFVALTLTYYDNYSWTNKSYTTAYNTQLNDVGKDESKKINLHPEDLPATASQQTISMVTGTKARVIKDPNNLALGDWLTTVNFFDNEGRMVQVHTETHALKTDVFTIRYDFTGNVVGTYLVHKTPDASTATTRVKTIFKYDPGGRMLETWKVINDNDLTKTLIASNEYNELGQLKKKNLGQRKDPATGVYTAVPVEILDYTYNVRGWLQGINKDYVAGQSSGNERYFGIELNYDWGFQTNQLNGNIAGMKWRSNGDGERRSYGYTYDPLNRLLGADYGQHNGTAYEDHNVIKFDIQMGDGQTVSSAYDENGNIRNMQQWGLLLNCSSIIDNLQYAYHINTNKLQRITDMSTVTEKLGDFKDKSTGLDDFGYDKNGNMITDLNKGLTGDVGISPINPGAIVYNHLNLPWKITVPQKGTITYIYDATGLKLQKIIEDISISGKITTTTTDYIGAMVYESKNTVGGTTPIGLADNYQLHLQFITQQEGRIRYVPAEGNAQESFAYDYFVKDHLGNVRMVLTDERKQDAYPAATLEGSRVAGAPSMINYEKQFYNINDTYIKQTIDVPGWSTAKDYANNNGNPPPNNSYPSGYTVNSTATSQYLYQLNATSNKTGLGVVLKVMAGDKIDVHGKSYYQSTQTYNNSNSTSLILADIIGAFIGAPDKAGFGLKGITAGTMETINAGLIPVSFMRGNNGESTTVPKAYINYLFFDEQFKYAGGGASRVGVSGTVKDHWFQDPQLQNINVPKNGYVYIYVSNESNANVFFDNLQVFHTRGPVLEETHYYPFGLTMAGISSKAMGRLENKYKFNEGTELQNGEFADGSGLDWYATDFRSYDPQIGRFHQIDLLSELNENYSGYAFANNNPILFNDPWGLDTLKRNDDGSLPTARPDGSELEDNDVIVGENGAVTDYYNGVNWRTPRQLAEVVVTPIPPEEETPPPARTESAQRPGTATVNRPPVVAPNNNQHNDPIGQREADYARSRPGRDMRTYSMSDLPNTVDCSRFTREVAAQAGYTIPRVAFDQARWYQRNGQWETNVNNARAGDHIFWLRGMNQYHTGIVTDNIVDASGRRTIRVVQAQTFGHRPGSVRVQVLMANGQMRGFNQPFVGVGRPR